MGSVTDYQTLCYNYVTNMKKAKASIYLDSNRPKKNGLCSVKIKITFNGKRKYFSTGVDLTKQEFETVFYGKRRTEAQKEIKTRVEYLENKANKVINVLSVFSFDAFEDRYLDQRAANSVSFAFDKYIDNLKLENRIGTAVSYECAKNSINKFKNNLTFADVTPRFLKQYEKWMLDNDNSKSTVGIYLRSLRAVYNMQNIDSSIYPFGKGKNKYKIPTSNNIKKALTIEEIGKIYNYQAETGSTKEMAKDLGVEGVHEHEYEGKTWYMIGETHIVDMYGKCPKGFEKKNGKCVKNK